jgi:enoyl-CoA hydratase/carnithine racemase
LPTIAAMRGVAFGGGLELAVSCDLRWLRAGARLGVTAAKLGLVYPHLGLQKYLRLLGTATVRRLLFSAETIDADEAARLGLVNHVVAESEFDAAVDAVATRIAACAPGAVQGIKRTLAILERGTPLSEADVLEMLALRQQSYRSADFAEGRAAFAAKRAPRFHGR